MTASTTKFSPIKSLSLHTIGFTGKTAEQFFGLIGKAGVSRLIDVRLNNGSQLAGFAKFRDLRFFAQAICGIDCIHLPILAPHQELFTAYKNEKTLKWPDFRIRFLDLMNERRVEEEISRDLVDGACLLCSEHEPHHCHRTLVAEYLRDRWSVDIEVRHLVTLHG